MGFDIHQGDRGEIPRNEFQGRDQATWIANDRVVNVKNTRLSGGCSPQVVTPFKLSWSDLGQTVSSSEERGRDSYRSSS